MRVGDEMLGTTAPVNFFFCRSLAGGTVCEHLHHTAALVGTQDAAMASQKLLLMLVQACVMRWWFFGGWLSSTQLSVHRGELQNQFLSLILDILNHTKEFHPVDFLCLYHYLNTCSTNSPSGLCAM